MTPHTESVRTTSGRAPVAADLQTWDPSRGLFMPPARRSNGIDRGALAVQITLCIVVAALLFSVIALPKLRVHAAKSLENPVSRVNSGGR